MSGLPRRSSARPTMELSSSTHRLASNSMASKSDEFSMMPAANQRHHAATASDQQQSILGELVDPWKSIKEGNLSAVKAMFQTRADFDIRGAVGETPIHFAFLHQKTEIAMWMGTKVLQLKAPELLTQCYDSGDQPQRTPMPLPSESRWFSCLGCKWGSGKGQFNHGGTSKSEDVLAEVDRECSSSPYHGENVLHLAIVNGSTELVDFLLKSGQGMALLEGRAIGSFFRRDVGLCYYGEYPLSFAVCANRPRLVRRLVAFGADLHAQDSWGNTALHLAVIRKNMAMYELLLELDGQPMGDVKARESDEDDDAPPAPAQRFRRDSQPTLRRKLLERIRNLDDFTAFTLAARLGAQHMFSAILHKRQIPMWNFGEVSSLLYPLHEVDHFDDVDENKSPPTALKLIVTYGHVNLLQDGVVTELLQQKWAKFAREQFMWRRNASLLYFVIFSLAIIYQPYKNNDSVTASVLEVLVLVGATIKGIWEFIEVISGGMQQYLCQKGSGFLENFAGSLFVIFIWIAAIFRAFDVEGEVVAVSMAALFGWVYLLFFCLGTRTTGPFIVMIWRMILGDLGRFVVIFFVFLMAFSQATYVLLQPSEGNDLDIGPFVGAIKLSFQALLGEFSYSDWEKGSYEVLASLLLIMFVIMATILLLNLLIAMMSDTYQEVENIAEQEWRLEWARIIFSIESEMAPGWERSNNRCCSWLLRCRLFTPSRPTQSSVSKKGVARIVQPEERGTYQYWMEINRQRYIQLLQHNESYFYEMDALSVVDGASPAEMSRAPSAIPSDLYVGASRPPTFLKQPSGASTVVQLDNHDDLHTDDEKIPPLPAQRSQEDQEAYDALNQTRRVHRRSFSFGPAAAVTAVPAQPYPASRVPSHDSQMARRMRTGYRRAHTDDVPRRIRRLPTADHELFKSRRRRDSVDPNNVTVRLYMDTKTPLHGLTSK